jgi:SP family sugar:H+ symporter-like MFS transporter
MIFLVNVADPLIGNLGYQFAITIALLASSVDHASENRTDTGPYRIPMAIKILWASYLSCWIIPTPGITSLFRETGQDGTSCYRS